MTYLVADDDENTADSDAAMLTFTITVLADTAPSFAATVADQIYTEGELVDLMLPEASGGNGPLTYSLRPAVPGLTFDPATRTLSGTADHGRDLVHDLSGGGWGRQHRTTATPPS